MFTFRDFMRFWWYNNDGNFDWWMVLASIIGLTIGWFLPIDWTW